MRRPDAAVKSDPVDQVTFFRCFEQFPHSCPCLRIAEYIDRKARHDKGIADRFDPFRHRQDILEIRERLKPDQFQPGVQMCLCHGLIFFGQFLILLLAPALSGNRSDIAGNIDFLYFPPFFFCTAAFLFYRRPCDTAGCSDVFIDSPQLLFPRRPPCIACTKSPDIGGETVRPQDIGSCFNIFPVYLFNLLRGCQIVILG